MATKPWPHARLVRSPLPWGCLPTAFSMATGIPFHKWIEAIGHDGGTIIYEYLPDPQKRRGFHPQELVRAALSFGIACTEIQVNPVITTNGDNRYPIAFKDGNVVSFLKMLEGQRAVVGGVMASGVGHAVAFDGVLMAMFDPNAATPSVGWGDFVPRNAYLLHRIDLTSPP